jgi:hypothetical protein
MLRRLSRNTYISDYQKVKEGKPAAADQGNLNTELTYIFKNPLLASK